MNMNNKLAIFLKNNKLKAFAFLSLLVLLSMCTLIGCTNKKKEPENFFSQMWDIMSGKSGEKIKQIEIDIQEWIDKEHPQLGLKVVSVYSMASLDSGNFDNYRFYVTDGKGLTFTAVWGNYHEQSFDFIEEYQDAVLYKNYTDTLQSKMPEDVRTKIFYRPQGHWEEPDNYMRFDIFSSEHPIDTKRVTYLIENIRMALSETIEVYDKLEFEASLYFIHPDKSVVGDCMQVYKENTWLVAEIRNENRISDLVLTGAIPAAMRNSIKIEFTGEQFYTSTEYFLIRQDDFSELFYIACVDATEESLIFMYGIYTDKMELKEKKEVIISREKGYRYKDIEDIIPMRFRYQYVPYIRFQPPIIPFFNPFRNS